MNDFRPVVTTAVTQSPGDNSTKLASTAYADAINTKIVEKNMGLMGLFMPWEVGASQTGLTANQAYGTRCVAPKTGTLHDLTVYVGTAAGTIDVGVYSTANPRLKLYSSGAISLSGSSAWQVVADPNLAVTEGVHYDLLFCVSSNSAGLGRRNQTNSSSANQLPASFLAGSGGAGPYVFWTIANGSATLGGSYADASIAANFNNIVIFGRVV